MFINIRDGEAANERTVSGASLEIIKIFKYKKNTIIRTPSKVYTVSIENIEEKNINKLIREFGITRGFTSAENVFLLTFYNRFSRDTVTLAKN